MIRASEIVICVTCFWKTNWSHSLSQIPVSRKIIWYHIQVLVGTLWLSKAMHFIKCITCLCELLIVLLTHSKCWEKKRRGRRWKPVEWYIVVPLSSGSFFCWIKFKIRTLLCLASKLSHFQVAINNLSSGGGEKQVKMSSWGIVVINCLGSSRAEFVTPNNIDILGWIIFCCEEPSCALYRMLAASLALAY